MDLHPIQLTGNSSAISNFIDRFDLFLFDCDGVLWSGDHLFEGTVETLEMLRRRGKKLLFVTNNSTKSRKDYKGKLLSMGIPAEEEEVFGSSYSAAIYISRFLGLPEYRKKVFVLGEVGIETELSAEGVPFVGGTDPSLRRDITPEDYKAIASGEALDPAVGAVLVGLDFHINYYKLALAFAYIQRGAKFLATNIDSTLPSSNSLFPGAGSISAPLVKMTGKEPMFFGKPSQAMIDAVTARFNLERERTCMIGDRLNTDIQFGIDGRLGGTLLVLTGVSQRSDFETENAPTKPMYFADKLSDLI